MAFSRTGNILATYSNAADGSLLFCNLSKPNWRPLRIPSLARRLISLAFSSSARDTLLALAPGALLIFDIPKGDSPRRIVSLATFTCTSMAVIPGILDVVVVAAEGGKLLLIDVGLRPVYVDLI